VRLSYTGPINRPNTSVRQKQRTEEVIQHIVSGDIIVPPFPSPNGEDMPLSVRTDVVDPDAVPEVLYKGEASPGTAVSSAAWRIQKISFQADGDVEILFADGDTSFDNVWDNRASLSYS